MAFLELLYIFFIRHPLWIQEGRTGASTRNWESYGDLVQDLAHVPHWRRDLLTDPQTSGGLLIAAAPDAANEILALARAEGFGEAAVVGRLVGRSMAVKPRVRLI